MDRDEIIRVLRAFEAVGLEYVLIGAAALGLHGVVRATEDLDKESEGIRVRIATAAALYRLKKSTLTAIDQQDAAALRERFRRQDHD